MPKNRLLFAAFSILSFVALFFVFQAFENTGRLKIRGKLVDPKGRPLSEVVVELKEFNKVISSTTTTGGGKFSVEVEYQKKQTLHFTKKGYVSMYLQVVSDIPLPKSDKNYTFSPEFFMVSDTADFNLNQFRKPITRVVYDPIEDFFVEDNSVLEDFVAKTNEPEGVILTGNLSPDDSTAIDSAVINIYEGKKVVESLNVDSTGKFEFKVFYNKQAKVEVIADNYYPTYFNLNTTMTNDSLSRLEFEISPTIPLVSIKTEFINPKAFELPVTEFSFQNDSGNFTQNANTKTSFYEVLDEPKKLPISIEGIALDSAGRELAGVDVRLKDGEGVISAMQTDKAGKYLLKAPYDKELDLVFEGKDFHTQIMEINTVRENKTYFKKLTLQPPPVKIYEIEDAYVEKEVFKNPMAYVVLSDTGKTFEEDVEVRQEFEEKINEIKKKNAPVVALANETYPETFGYLYIDGRISNLYGDKIDSATVTAFIGNVEYRSLMCDKRGGFELELQYNKEYEIEVERRNHATMRFLVDATLPKDLLEKDNSHQMDIPLIPLDYENLNENAYGMPFTRIYYDTLEKELMDDEEVLAAFQNRLNTPEVNLLPKKLVLTSAIQDYSRRMHKDLAVYVKEDETIVDTLEVDRDGNYTASLDYNKTYKIEYSGDEFFNSFIEVESNLSGEPKPDSVTLSPVQAFLKDDESVVDPSIFQNPVRKVAFDPLAGVFNEDSSAVQKFQEEVLLAQKMAEVASKRLLVKGTVKDGTEKRMKDAKVYLVENFQKTDSVTTNRRGQFEINVPFLKDYKLRVKKEGYYNAFASVDSRMPQDSVKDFDIDMSTITIVEQNTEDIDVTAFALPAQRIYYDIGTNSFFEDTLANNQFLAKLWAPKREKERLLAEEKKKNAAKQIKTTPATIKDLGTLTAETIQEAPALAMPKPPEDSEENYDKATLEQKQKEASLGEKSGESEAFLLSLMAPDTSKPKESIKDAQLETELLEDIEFVDFELPEIEEVDEAELEQQEQVYEFNQLLADLSLRRGLSSESIKIDSVFSVMRPVRIYKSERFNGKIFQTYRVKIVDSGEVIDLIHIHNWFGAATSFYINGESVKEKEYYAQLEKYNTSDTYEE